ncbi:outer membrane protein [Aquamicrobium segne]|uniref:Outer membrane protein n=1 Tax=Aquamicrobium segne TaxID=469547 RepID=A0ABW0GW38_9HYPH
MSYLFRKTSLAVIIAGGVSPVLAADLDIPMVIEEPAIVQPYAEVREFGGWYIRGDVDYHKSKIRGTEYFTYGAEPCPDDCGDPDAWTGVGGTKSFDTAALKSSFSLGAGVGYQANRYFRTDLTLDYWFKSKFRGGTSDEGGYSCGGGDGPCESVDRSKMSALLLLANAYVDLGTWNGITPYVGAGIGGAHVKWGDLINDIGGYEQRHKGAKSWRFAYALMAGASYCLTDRTVLDAGYRFSRIEGGRMFEKNGAGPGFDKGFNTHEVRAGLRYSFGGSANGCYEPQTVAYEPPAPIYTK